MTAYTNEDSTVLDWLLHGSPDVTAIRNAWRVDPAATQVLATGNTFDAVVMPRLLGYAVRLHLDTRCLYPPLACLGDDIVVLRRPGSTWQGPGVPAALETHGAGSAVRLPHPHSDGWLAPPNGGRLPGFIPLLSAARDVLWHDYQRGVSRASVSPASTPPTSPVMTSYPLTPEGPSGRE